MSDKKVCPLNIGRLTLLAKLKNLFNGTLAVTSYCRKEECAWWDEDGKKCAVKGLIDIADVMWNDEDLSRYADSHQEEEIQKLQMYLMKNHQGKLDGDKTPVETAISILGGDNS